ncbi:hypothetical protein MYA98_19495 [Salmonella sp. WGH-01]|nr:hypothetical protein MYA98_19495 [Salmonella sp. WGH-01]
MQDASCYQLASVLTLAAEHRDTPENLLRYLAKIRGISPFLTAAESCPEAAIPNAEFLYTPFATALRQHNVPIVRFLASNWWARHLPPERIAILLLVKKIHC